MSVHDQSLKSLWQTLPAQRITITAEQMRARARKFEAKHKRRDIIEYIGYALFFAAITYMLTVHSDWQMWVASGLAVGGGLIAMWNYNKYAKAKPMPASHSGDKLLNFMRREITRQRDAAASMWKWYLLPAAPFIIFVMIFRWIEEGSTLFEITETRISLLFMLGLALAVFSAYIFWYFLNAARYQRELDNLDRLG